MKTIVYALAAVLAFAVPAAGQSTLTVEGGQIAEAAANADGVRVYKGLPYAAPPVGNRRWRAPAAVVPWQGVRPVDRAAPNCLQQKVFGDINPFVPEMSEDCLYLNVWTTAKAGARRPVFVWIHGGGYLAGYGNEPRHDGRALAKQGLVVVTLNYRLGVFGFLAHPELSAEAPDHASGDYAFLDMIAALQWVRRNIAQFGGDPALVTIAGESAGSDAVSRLMASPLAHGLFARAIGESGASFGTMPDATLPAAEEIGKQFGLSMNGDALAAMRKRSAAEIMVAAQSGPTRGAFPVVIGGSVLPASSAALFAAGQQNDVPLLVGWNADEGRSFQGVLPNKPLSELLQDFFGDKATAAEAFYPIAADKALTSRQALAGDRLMEYPTWSWAVAQKKSGKAPVYLYLFRHYPPIPGNGAGNPDAPGAYHSGEIPYIFGHPEQLTNGNQAPAETQLGETMSHCWAAFAKTGRPQGKGCPRWPAYDPDGSALRMVFDTTSAAAADEALARHRFYQQAVRPSSP